MAKHPNRGCLNSGLETTVICKVAPRDVRDGLAFINRSR
jgi:hypothetical protein